MQRIAATSDGPNHTPLRLAQIPTQQSPGLVGPKFAEPQPAPRAPLSYGKPFKIYLKGSTSRFDYMNRMGNPKEELELVLRSWQSRTPLDEPSSNPTSGVRFAEMDVTITDPKTKLKARDLPIRWSASGGIYREWGFIRDKNPSISKIKTNEYGFALSQWVPKHSGLYRLWVEILKPDGSVFQKSKEISIRVRNAAWKAQTKTGEWSETPGQTDVYQRPVYLMWQLDDPADLRRLANVRFAPSVKLPDGTPAPADVSWFDSKSALSVAVPGKGLGDKDLAPSAIQFARYDPIRSPVRDLDALTVAAALAAPISPQLQTRMNVEEKREETR